VDGSVTAFDAVVLGVLLLSGLLALVRGFIRETLSVAAFVAASLAALWMLPVLREPVRGVIQPGWAADIAAVVGVFLLVYLAVTLITSSIAKHLRGGDEPGMLDRVAGLAFGVARGVVILALFVILYTAFVPPDRPSRWLTEARLYPMVSATAVALQELAPESSHIASTPVPATATQAAPAAPAASPAPAPAREAENTPPEDEAAYGETTRRSLDQLIGAKADAENEGDAQ